MNFIDRAKVHAAFAELKADQTGTVRIHEFKQVLSTQFHISDEETPQAFHALDTTDDDEIQYSAFLAALASNLVQLCDDLLRETFRTFDVECDGYISFQTSEEFLGNTCNGLDAEQMLHDASVFKGGKLFYQDWVKFLHGETWDNYKINGQVGEALLIIPNPRSAQDDTQLENLEVKVRTNSCH